MMNFNKLKNQKLGQIGIFIVLAVILLVLVVFLIFSSNSKKLSLIEGSNSDIDNLQGELLPLKISIDTCLETQLKTGLVIAGLRGGLIYQNNERYVSSNGIDNYDLNLLNNFNLNQNYLSQNLIHSQYDVFMPRFNSDLKILVSGANKTIYSHSITEDFKRFILSDLSYCLNFEDLKQEYEITQNIFFGNLVEFDAADKILTSTPFDANIGDTVSVVLDGTIYYGEVLFANPGDDIISLFDDIPTFSETIFRDIVIINLNNSVELDIVFEDDKVSTKLKYPIILEKDNKKVYFKETKVSVKTRFKKLLELGNYLLSQKISNRTLNYETSDSLESVLKLNPFFMDLNDTELDFQISVSNNEIGYKLKTISIIDNRYKLFSNPFVLNLGYENSAPTLTLTNLGTESYGNLSIYDIETGYFGTNVNKFSKLNLRDFLKDKQLLDNYESYFIKQDISNSQYEFNLSNEGILEFIASEDGVYNFEIEVTDRESISIYQFTFDVGIETSYVEPDLSRYAVLFLDGYSVGDTNLVFTKQLGIYDGKIEVTNPLTKMSMNIQDFVREDLEEDVHRVYPDVYYSLDIKGTFPSEDLEVTERGMLHAAVIPNPVADLFVESNQLQYRLLNSRSIPKTQVYLSSILSMGTGITIVSKNVNIYSRSYYKFRLSHEYDPGSIVTTEFEYFNQFPPVFNNPDDRTFNPINLTALQASGTGRVTISTGYGSDGDYDTISRVITTRRFPGGHFGTTYFIPNRKDTYKFDVYLTDGELKSSVKTLTYTFY